MIFNKGDLVSVKIDVLLEDHMSMIGMTAYKARPDIYGVVTEKNTDWGWYVSWSMQRMFYLDMNKLNVGYEYIGTMSLTLLKSKDNSDFRNDPYTDSLLYSRQRRIERSILDALAFLFLSRRTKC